MNERPKLGSEEGGANLRVWVVTAGLGCFRPGRRLQRETPRQPLHDTFVIRLAMATAYHRAVERRVYRPRLCGHEESDRCECSPAQPWL